MATIAKRLEPSFYLQCAVILVSAGVTWASMGNAISSLSNEMTRAFIKQDVRIDRLERMVERVNEQQIRIEERENQREKNRK